MTKATGFLQLRPRHRVQVPGSSVILSGGGKQYSPAVPTGTGRLSVPYLKCLGSSVSDFTNQILWSLHRLGFRLNIPIRISKLQNVPKLELLSINNFIFYYLLIRASFHSHYLTRGAQSPQTPITSFFCFHSFLLPHDFMYVHKLCSPVDRYLSKIGNKKFNSILLIFVLGRGCGIWTMVCI